MAANALAAARAAAAAAVPRRGFRLDSDLWEFLPCTRVRVHTHTLCILTCTHVHARALAHMRESLREPGALAFADSSPRPWPRTRPQRASTGSPSLSRRSCLASHSTAKDPAHKHDAVCITFYPQFQGPCSSPVPRYRTSTSLSNCCPSGNV